MTRPSGLRTVRSVVLRARHLTAWISLIALTVGLAAPMLPGLHTLAAAADDCAKAAGPSHDLRRVTVPGAAAQTPDHCVMCHWLRTARSASLTLAARTEAPDAGRPLVLALEGAQLPRAVVLERPSRAPPSA